MSDSRTNDEYKQRVCQTATDIRLAEQTPMWQREFIGSAGGVPMRSADNSSGLSQINAPQCGCTPQAAQDADVVDRMLKAFDAAKDQDYNSSPSERRDCMTAALAEARKGWYSEEQVRKALQEEADSFSDWGVIVHPNLVRDVLARFSTPARAKGAEEVSKS